MNTQLTYDAMSQIKRRKKWNNNISLLKACLCVMSENKQCESIIMNILT